MDTEMVQQTDIPVPDPHLLFPPLLRCLFAGSWAEIIPPALPELLTPILRQRVKLHYEDPAIEPGSDEELGWLFLLCWDKHEALSLGNRLGAEGLELHPVSGRVEFDDPDPPLFRRRDEDTLQAKFLLDDLGLEVFYTWCPEDRVGPHEHWKVSEVFAPYDDLEVGEDGKPKKDQKDGQKDEHEGWYSTIAMADQAFAASAPPVVPRTHYAGPSSQGDSGRPDERMVGDTNGETDDDADDDAYWGRYNNTSGKASVEHRSPPLPYVTVKAGPVPTLSEDDHYAQYQQVQPTMDGDAMDDDATDSDATENDRSNQDRDDIIRGFLMSLGLGAPSPTTNPSVSRRPTNSAAAQSTTGIAIRQHIRNSMRELLLHFADSFQNLRQLAISAGIEEGELKELIFAELSPTLRE